jgi:hypothetical protein
MKACRQNHDESEPEPGQRRENWSNARYGRQDHAEAPRELGQADEAHHEDGKVVHPRKVDRELGDGSRGLSHPGHSESTGEKELRNPQSRMKCPFGRSLGRRRGADHGPTSSSRNGKTTQPKNPPRRLIEEQPHQIALAVRVCQRTCLVIRFAAMRNACTRFATPLIVVLAILAITRPTRAQEESSLTWDLITIGPDTDLFSLWGHTALCVSAGEFEGGSCFDFGVAREEDAVRLAVGTLQGQPLFVVVKVPARVLLASSQFRDTWRQRITLDDAHGRKLLAELEHAVAARARYAYQPLDRNCTTEVRDRLDRALAGKLRIGAEERSGSPLRTVAEAGISGRVLPLTLTALAGGKALDRPSTEWERMALPQGLMQAVSARLSAAPSRVFTRADAPPPTSPQAGRLSLVLLTALVSWSIGRALRRSPDSRAARSLLAAWLSLLSLAPLLGAVSTLPSLHGNWMLLLLSPLDILLAWGKHTTRWHERYVALRLALIVLVAAAAASGLLVQSLWIGGVITGLPLGTWLLVRKRMPRAA